MVSQLVVEAISLVMSVMSGDVGVPLLGSLVGVLSLSMTRLLSVISSAIWSPLVSFVWECQSSLCALMSPVMMVVWLGFMRCAMEAV